MARILIVDDEPLIAMMLDDWVSDLGHTTIGPARDLSTALSLAKTNIDAAIVDVSLGDETSYPLARVLTSRGVPFVFATGHDPARLDSGYVATAILAKPLEFDDLRRAIRAMLN